MIYDLLYDNIVIYDILYDNIAYRIYDILDFKSMKLDI